MSQELSKSKSSLGELSVKLSMMPEFSMWIQEETLRSCESKKEILRLQERLAGLEAKFKAFEARYAEKVEELECNIYGHGYEIDQRLQRLEGHIFAEMPELEELD